MGRKDGGRKVGQEEGLGGNVPEEMDQERIRRRAE